MKKKVIIILLVTLVVAAIIIGVVLALTNGSHNPIANLTLNKSTLTMTVGDEETLVASIKGTPYDEATWTVEPSGIVAVDNNGVVTALAQGNATVTASSADGAKASCTIVVIERVINVESLSLDRSTLAIKVNDEVSLIATVKPDDATNKDVKWSVEPSGIVFIDNQGLVKAAAAGIATITAKTVDGGKTATCVVTVTSNDTDPDVPPSSVSIDSISLNKDSLTLDINNEETLIATVLPNNATNKEVTWSSNDTTVVKVQNGKVTAVAAGEATVTVTTVDGNKTASCVVTVPAPVVAVQSVFLNTTSLTLEVGQQSNLTATVSPDNATNKEITWSSNNTSIVSVENGKVTAVAAGEATVTVTTVDGNKKQYCYITVKEPVVAVESVSLNKDTLTLYIGYSEMLVATVLPDNVINKQVTWTSDNMLVATVSDNGSVSALAAGTATITVTTVDGDKTATCVVTVPDPLQYYQVVDDNEVPIAYGVNGITPENIEKVTSVKIPAQHDGMPVTHIASYAFYNSKVSSITMPTTITYIGSEIFKARYPYVTYEGTLAEWCAIPSVRGLFESWPYDTFVYIKDAETGKYIRLQDESLTTLSIPEGVTSIGSGAFLDTYLTTLELPASITKLGEFAISRTVTIKYKGDVSSWCQIEGIDGFANSYFPFSLEIGDTNVATLESINISHDVTKITKSSLSLFTSLQTVNYDGTSQQWNAILDADSGLVATATVCCLRDCPIEEDQIIKVPVGTPVSALYEQYTELTTQDGKWQLYMYYPDAPFAGDDGYIQLGDSQTMLEGEFDCKLVYQEQSVNFKLIGLPECPISNGSSMEGIVGAEIGALYQGYPTLINDYGMWMAYMKVNDNWVELDKSDTIPSEGTFQMKLVFEGENVVIRPADIEFTIIVEHLLNHIEQKDATCSINGNIEYYVCEQCGKFFFDEKGENEINDKASVTIASSGHEYDNNGVCTVCGAKQPTDGILYELSEDGTYAIVKGVGETTETDLVVADSYQGVPVTCIAEYAFVGKPITSIYIPDSVTSIGEAAFAGCEFTSITIPRGLTSIGRQLFSSCSSLTTVTIHDAVTSIEWHAFYNCDALVSIILPDSVTTVGDDVVGSCDSFTTVYYIGTEESWSEIDISASNKLNTATRYYYSATRPDEEGNYWHYDTDEVTPVIW